MKKVLLSVAVLVLMVSCGPTIDSKSGTILPDASVTQYMPNGTDTTFNVMSYGLGSSSVYMSYTTMDTVDHTSSLRYTITNY